MVAVVLLVVLRDFAVAVAGGADGRAGALVCAIGQDEDLAGETGLDDAVSAGCGQVVGAVPALPAKTTGACRPDVR